MIYDKNNNYLRSFHKNTINTIHLWRTNVSRKYSPPPPPCHVSTRSFREDIARDFQIICFLLLAGAPVPQTSIGFGLHFSRIGNSGSAIVDLQSSSIATK